MEVRSAGDRDPDGDGIEGMSASKQRKYAAENDFDNFLKGVPTAMNKKMAKDLFNNIRTGMNIKEGWNLWEIAPIFDWKNLREKFVGKKIYKVGDLVENLNTGLVGRITRRGTNYLICVTEDKIMFKSWIKDVAETRMPNVSRKDKNVIAKRGKNIFKKDLKGTVLGTNEAVVNGTSKSGVPSDQRLVGTDAHRKYVEKLVPGSSWGLHFINKYRKK